MASLHDADIGKGRKITGYILSVIPSLLLVFSGVMKLLAGDFMVQNMSQLKLLSLMQFIGVLELVCVALYWIPRTMNLGFFLLCSYAGGILAAELISTGGQALPIPGLPLAILLYVGTFLRKKGLSGLDI
ncbi:MAG: DoxX family protein [Bacteroidota bacterium]